MGADQPIGSPLHWHLAGVCDEGCAYCAKRRRVEAQERGAALLAVAHAAWHVLDDGGEVPDEPDGFTASLRDANTLSDALDALEATGWRAHFDIEPPSHLGSYARGGSGDAKDAAT